MVRARSQSSDEIRVPAKRSCSHSVDLSLSTNQSINRTETRPRDVLNLLTYDFVLLLVVEHLCDRDVVARLLTVNKSIRLMMQKYVFKELISSDNALDIIHRSRDITFSVSRVRHSPLLDANLLIEVQRENMMPLKEVHFTLRLRREFDEKTIIPHFVTHLTCINLFHDTGARLPVGSIPNNVVHLDLQTCVHVIGSIPPSVKRLSMSIQLTDFDPAAIPNTVTDLDLKRLCADHGDEIRFMFPTSVKNLSLGELARPFAPGVLSSSVCQLECDGELLMKLEPGVIPNSVKKMRFCCDISHVPKAGVLPDSVTHIQMISTDSHPHPLPRWPMPVSLTSLEMILPHHTCITPGIVPATVTHLKCSSRVDPRALSNSIAHLQICIFDSHDGAGIIPSSVTHLHLMGKVSDVATLTPGIIPSSITHLIFCSNKQQKMVPGIIPDSVTHLTFDANFNQAIPEGVIPQSVTHLAFGRSFNQDLISGSLPRSLTHLCFGSRFNRQIDLSVIPLSVTHLMMEGCSDFVINRNAFSSVTHLTIDGVSDQNFDETNLPCLLTHLEVPPSYVSNGKLQVPAHVTHLSYQNILSFDRITGISILRIHIDFNEAL